MLVFITHKIAVKITLKITNLQLREQKGYPYQRSNEDIMFALTLGESELSLFPTQGRLATISYNQVFIKFSLIIRQMATPNLEYKFAISTCQ